MGDHQRVVDLGAEDTHRELLADVRLHEALVLVASFSVDLYSEPTSQATKEWDRRTCRPRVSPEVDWKKREQTHPFLREERLQLAGCTPRRKLRGDNVSLRSPCFARRRQLTRSKQELPLTMERIRPSHTPPTIRTRPHLLLLRSPELEQRVLDLLELSKSEGIRGNGGDRGGREVCNKTVLHGLKLQCGSAREAALNARSGRPLR